MSAEPIADEPGAAEPLRDEPFTPEILERSTPFQGKVWDVVSETFRYNGEPITREFVDHTGAVAVLAMDDEERVLLIRQYRHPIRSRDWEIPAGLLDEDGEPALTAAQRELAEEADLAAEQWNVLAEYVNSPGGSNETVRVYLARGVSEVDAFEREAEEADIEVRWVSLDEALAAVLSRDLQNPSTVIGVLTAAAHRASGWADLAPGDAPWPRHPKLGRADW
ncbi:NUDIX domain-containing protein [Naasia aerilata]|uniref:NUDIX hydrolase n=1 Tax=Naasia aerilata TaxID=1162966 RepID=A0ABM8GGQ2_9MICO|nr:NUDIX hydrolase [Naasia aerilata]BDZ47516.1 NUDIX hydrolase [Naasia aerilata]